MTKYLYPTGETIKKGDWVEARTACSGAEVGGKYQVVIDKMNADGTVGETKLAIGPIMKGNTHLACTCYHSWKFLHRGDVSITMLQELLEARL